MFVNKSIQYVHYLCSGLSFNCEPIFAKLGVVNCDKRLGDVLDCLSVPLLFVSS